MRAFLERVAATISRHGMIAPGQLVLVAFSGGADSTALLHALHTLGYRVAAGHVHHGLRGEEADTEATHAAAVASSLGLPFAVRRAEARVVAAEQKLSLETAAREVRYRLLEAMRVEFGVDRIATGHTADDQAETVLLNLLRGAGPAGLSGIPPVREAIIRPLLGVTHAEVLAYCEAAGLEYRTDSSNTDLRFTRNRIRLEAMPRLRAVQPGVVGALSRLAEIMRAEEAFTAEAAARALAEIATEEAEGITLSRAGFVSLPLALQRRVARAALAKVRGSDRDLELERIEALVELATQGRTGGVVEFPEGWRVERTYGALVIRRKVAPSAAPTGEWALPVPGEVTVPELGVKFTARVSDDLSIATEQEEATLDADRTGTVLRVRTPRPKDSFAPLGMEGWYRLSDFLKEAKVPRARRPWVPVVLGGPLVLGEPEHIVWVVGQRVSERYKVTAETRRTVRVRVDRV